MSRYFVHNLETDKLNIYTGGKSDWLTIPDSDRERIKSACLWSRSINGWVSRGKGDSWNVAHLKTLLPGLGFEDRGTEGQRLSFAEQVEAKQERAEERADRMESRAERAEETSNALSMRSHEMMSAIPMGQPILVGHHSEQRDRNYRERAWNMMGRAVAESDKAKHYEHRAALARETAKGKQYSDPAYLGNRIKECKAEIGILQRYLAGKRFGTEAAERMNAAACDEPTERTVTDTDRERWGAMLSEQEERLAFFEHCLSTCGREVFSRETLKGKQAVKIRGRWEPIVKLNPTTVAVPNICFPLEEHQRKYALKYAYTEVQEAR